MKSAVHNLFAGEIFSQSNANFAGQIASGIAQAPSHLQILPVFNGFYGFLQNFLRWHTHC